MDISRKPQFDAGSGGNVEVPSSIRIQALVRARMGEIEALTNLIEAPSTQILRQQKFPKHLRRRAMSHNVKRLPTRLRDEHIDKIEKGSCISELPIKRPRRKYRRRPSNLLADYNRRQRDNVWLETHIWHAKRFHMAAKWGYKLPDHPNDKCYRACYRASKKFCLIQDISYYCCIEISGNLDEILTGLKMHCSSKCGLTFSSSYIRSGCFEGCLVFYESTKYPDGAIGEIKYFWQPPLEGSTTRVLWIWCHPSYYKQVLEELVRTFSLELEEDMEVEDTPIGAAVENKKQNIERIKILGRNVPFNKTPKYRSSNNSVTLALLKDTLNRFRLIGPLSQALLTDAFQPVDLSQRTIQDWASNYYKEDGLCYMKQLEFWSKMKNYSSPGQLPRHIIISMIVVDPRFTLPFGRKQPTEETKETEIQPPLVPTPELSKSIIWSSNVRDEVTCAKLSTHQLNEMRSNKLVPGLEIESKDKIFHNYPAVPILLIQHPGEERESKCSGYGSGWDVIVPCGYGMPVWLALHLHGGRAGGLREQASVSREHWKDMFPPDTTAGKEQVRLCESEAADKYFGLPPAKRQNYIKLGISFPFTCAWEILVKDWTGNKLFHVLRDRNKLIDIKNKLKNKDHQISFDEQDYQSLVPVCLKLNGKGTLLRNSLICIPELDDLEQMVSNKTFLGPVEPPHKDVHESERNKSRMEHKTLLKRLSRKRRKARKNKEESEDMFSSENVVEDQKHIMKNLWIPECDSVKDKCTRTIFGFVNEADFLFTSAQTVGLGYVTLKGLLKFLNSSTLKSTSNQVLIRSINSLQYRFSTLSIIL